MAIKKKSILPKAGKRSASALSSIMEADEALPELPVEVRRDEETDEATPMMPGLTFQKGPLGNLDFVAFGSPAHAALLGIDPASGETMFDIAEVPAATVERFVGKRKKWLKAKPGLPKTYRMPEMWSPESDGLTVVTPPVG